MMAMITDRNQRKTLAALCIAVLAVAAPIALAQGLTFGGLEVVEDEVEDQVEEQVEDQVEDTVTDTTTDVVEDVVEDSVEEQVVDSTQDAVEDQLTFGGLPDAIEDQIEEQVEDQVSDAVDDDVVDSSEEVIEEQVADQTEDVVEDQVGDQTEETVEDQVADQTEGALEQEVEEQVVEATEQQVVDITEETVEDTLTEEVEADIEDSVVASAEDDLAGALEDDVADQLEDQVSDSAEEQAASQAENQVADAVEEEAVDAAEEQIVAAAEEQTLAATEETAEQGVEESVADVTEETLEESVADTTETTVSEQIGDSVEVASEGALELAMVSAAEERLEAEVDQMVDDIESDIDIDENRIHQGQWLVMAEPRVFDELADEGYLFDKFTELPGLGLRLAEVAAPASFDISSAREGIMDVVGSDRAEVDLNHIYTAGAPETLAFEGGVLPRDAMPFPADVANLDLRIGIIDSSVDTSHSAFKSARINAREFTSSDDNLPSFHGTAIASIFAANDDQMQGLAPNAELFTAAVFERDSEQGEIASTVSLVKALDWLLSSQVDAVNLSLAGPPNRLLEVALKRVKQQGVLVLAAAGNGGPMARPKYPAAYDTVVAVTAVDEKGRAFRLANRGDYLDLAAPGVNLKHALTGGGYAASSGTSFAVPFAATAAASLMHREPGSDVLATLYASATDLGPPGRDEIYGYGLLRP